MPSTVASFPPLGFIIVVMLGAGVAERAGLFAAIARTGVAGAPRPLLTPAVVLVGVAAHHMADAAYLVIPPLAAAAFAAAGRHPVAGAAAAFASVGGAQVANLFPGGLDAILLGLTQGAAQMVDPQARVTVAANWWFTLAAAAVFAPTAWWVTDRLVEPRLQAKSPWRQDDVEPAAATPREGAGLLAAAAGAAAVTALWGLMSLPPGPLSAAAGDAMPPLFPSLVAYVFAVFLVTGAAFGVVTGSVRRTGDVLRMMTAAMADLAPYLVLVFVAAHFVALLSWSNLGQITAVAAAGALQQAPLPPAVLLGAVVLIAAALDFVVPSASAKWAVMAPVLVPALLLAGISPEMTTAAYRVGDSVFNSLSPATIYFGVVLGVCRKWSPGFPPGRLLRTMLPYSLAFLCVGLALTSVWAAVGAPPGPGASAVVR